MFHYGDSVAREYLMAAAKDNSVIIRRCIKDNREWLSEVGESIRQSAQEGLRDNIDRDDYRAIKTLGTDLVSMANYYAIQGSNAIIDGNSHGWSFIDTSAKYRYWEVKYGAAVALLQSRPEYAEPFNEFNTLYHELPIASSLLCYAAVLDREEMCRELQSLWKAILATPKSVTENYWGGAAEGKYELFVYRLLVDGSFGHGVELPSDLRRHPIGPYAHVFDAWEQPETMERVLSEICDYHCHNLEQASNRGPRPPFASPPFDLVPYEVLVIYKLRERQGLETPEIDHPLMKLATASLAHRATEPVDDPLLAQVEALFQKHCQAHWDEMLHL
jgi:hypothetical protein